MTWAYVSAGAKGEANYAAVTPGAPASRASGNTLVLLSHVRNAVASFTGYGSWALLGSHTASQSTVWAHAITDDGALSMPTLTPTGGAAGQTCLAVVYNFSGGLADAASLVAHSTTRTNATPDQTVETPALTITTPNTLVLHAFAQGDANTTVSGNAAGFTLATLESSSLGSNSCLGLCYQIQTTATNLNADVITISGASTATSGVVTLALKPAAGASIARLAAAYYDTLRSF